MKVTLKQIAERTGVSINTVSMVLRGMSGISAPTRERVRRAAEEMGYRRQLKPAATKQSLCLVSAERHRRDSYSYTEFNRIFMSYAAAHEFSVVTAEAEQFRALAYDFWKIGDCAQVRKIFNARREGYNAGSNI